MNRKLSAMSIGTIAGFWAAQAQSQSNATDENADIETIIVTGTEAALAAERAQISVTPGAVTLVDLDGLREQNVASIADALRYVPGVWSVSGTGNDGIFFSSRGSNLDATHWDMNGIKILQDGLPVTAADGNNHNRIIDPLSARYATMARGANALSFGASTLGGAVNFISATGRDYPGTSVAVTTGSHGQNLARFNVGGELGESGDGLLTVESKRWDGYRDHNEQDRIGLYANAGWQINDRVETRFYLTMLENDQEIPGSLTREQFETDPDRANKAAVDGHYQLNVDTLRVANRTSWQIDDNRTLDFGVSYEDQTLYHPIVWVAVDFDGPGPAPETEVFSLLVDTDHRDVGAMLRYSQQIGRHELVVGLNYGDNDVEGEHYRNLRGERNGLSTLVNNSASTTEIFALGRVQLAESTRLIVAAQAVSARRDVRNDSVAFGFVTDPSANYDQVNPRLGLVHSLESGISVYGNLSRLFEPPTNFELEDNVAGGSATLEPMTGSVFEIGTRGERRVGSAAQWSWDVALYYAEIDDEILSQEDPNAPGTSLVTNFDRTIHAGIEALLRSDISLGPGRGSLEPLLSATFNDFRFDGDPIYGNNDLPAAPEYFVRGELLYRTPNGFFVGPTIERVGKRWADFENSYRIDTHTLIGIRAGWSNERWRVFADIRNLTDEDYVVSHSVRNAASVSDAILNPGEPLSAYFGMEARF